MRGHLASTDDVGCCAPNAPNLSGHHTTAQNAQAYTSIDVYCTAAIARMLRSIAHSSIRSQKNFSNTKILNIAISYAFSAPGRVKKRKKKMSLHRPTTAMQRRSHRRPIQTRFPVLIRKQTPAIRPAKAKRTANQKIHDIASA